MLLGALIHWEGDEEQLQHITKHNNKVKGIIKQKIRGPLLEKQDTHQLA